MYWRIERAEPGLVQREAPSSCFAMDVTILTEGSGLQSAPSHGSPILSAVCVEVWHEELPWLSWLLWCLDLVSATGVTIIRQEGNECITQIHNMGSSLVAT